MATPKPLADMYNSILETHEAIGHIMREQCDMKHEQTEHGRQLTEHSRQLTFIIESVGELANKVDSLMPTRPDVRSLQRPKFESVSDLDGEITSSGTTHYHGTHDQIDAIVDARIRAREKKIALVRDASVWRWFKKRPVAHVATAGVSTALTVTVTVFWDVIKAALFHR